MKDNIKKEYNLSLIRVDEATKDMSFALGIEENECLELMVKAYNGDLKYFERLGLYIKRGSSSEETFKNLIEFIENRFGGIRDSCTQRLIKRRLLILYIMALVLLGSLLKWG